MFALITMCPQNETRVILNILYSCKTIEWTLSRDIMMALAIKRIGLHNLLPHLRYVSTLPEITQKPKRDIDELKQRFIDTKDRIPQGIIDAAIDQWQTRLRACVKAKGRHLEHLLWSRHTTGSETGHFRHIKTGSFQSHSHYREEDNITFRLLAPRVFFLS